MAITATFRCDGCDAKAEGTKPLGRQFHGITGRAHGFGHHRYDTANDVVPDGWTAYCIIGCCYCPACTAELNKPTTGKE